MIKTSWELHYKVRELTLSEIDEISVSCFTATEFAVWHWLRSESEETLSDIARRCNVSRQAVHFVLKVFYACGIAKRDMIEAKARECKRRITFRWLDEKELYFTGTKKLMERILKAKAR